ncbi:hypothetical protein [Variovorax rhizosphaerae]|uniref:HEPN domain-containing protein n=1 Tax=Variovorax rhizosphaerae TaxID=1836200 RepID=A0ABU8WYW2_9BURK
MAKRWDALYLPDPLEPEGVLPWGKSPEQTEEDLENSVARIGGHCIPNYGQSYLLAAEALLQTAKKSRALDHFALPIFYMQRHAAESLIKEGLQLAVQIQEHRRQLEKPDPDFLTEKQCNTVYASHDLFELLRILEGVAVFLDAGEIPEVLHGAVAEIGLFEQGEATRSRYSMHVVKKTNELIPHLNKSRPPIPCVQAMATDSRAASKAPSICLPIARTCRASQKTGKARAKNEAARFAATM